MNISVLGIDIAKNIFQLHGVDSSGKRILKQRIEREKLSAYVANLPLSTIARLCRKNFHIGKLH